MRGIEALARGLSALRGKSRASNSYSPTLSLPRQRSTLPDRVGEGLGAATGKYPGTARGGEAISHRHTQRDYRAVAPYGGRLAMTR